MALHGDRGSCTKCFKILNKFREKYEKVIHVRHEFNIENPPFFFALIHKVQKFNDL